MAEQNDWLRALKLIAWFVVLIWLVHALNTVLGGALNSFGIYPRRLESLPGILAWPLLHGGLAHLVMNTTPLLLMGYFVALRGTATFVIGSLLIVVLGGLGVWLFGRAAFHIGASGLVFGYFGFLVALAVYELSLKSFAIASLTLFYYGGIILGVLPTNSFVSWEGHLFGLLAGVLAARLLAIRPQPSPRR